LDSFYCYARDVIETTDNNLAVIVRTFYTEADFEILKSRSTMILLNENGDSLWSRRFNLPQYDNEGYGLSLYDIEATPDNGFVMAGIASVQELGLDQIPALVKTDNLGNDGTFIKAYKQPEILTPLQSEVS